MRSARIALLALSGTLLALLASGCLSSLPGDLPAGSGQGSYSGTFNADDEENSVIGSFTLAIDGAGLATGSGQLQGRDVLLTGQLEGDLFDGRITDALSGLSGRFDGDLFGNAISGDLRLPQTGPVDQLEALWNAARN